MISPRGGFKFTGDGSAYEIDQALVIGDVDTHPEFGNLTLTLSVDQGLLVLGRETQLGDNSPAVFHILLVESRLVWSIYAQLYSCVVYYQFPLFIPS
jgi:hypothetical protein